MLWDDMNRAVSEAKTTISRADSMIKQMGYIMRGKLRSGGVSEYVLEDFKKFFPEVGLTIFILSLLHLLFCCSRGLLFSLCFFERGHCLLKFKVC